MTLGPFKNDSVGSFLRPAALKEAREQYKKQLITHDELRAIEDQAIIDLIQKQKKYGLKAVTDGEFRRRWWHLDYIVNLTGLTKLSLGDATIFQGVEAKDVESYYVSDKLAFNPNHPFLADFKFLKEHAGEAIAKQTIPGPCMVYFSGALLSKDYQANPVYDNLADLENDIVQTYQDGIQAFYEAGCRYLQLDDTAWGALIDEKYDKMLGALNLEPASLLAKFEDLTRRSLANKPADMAITFHTCRGNFQSSWLYEGSFDTILEHLFKIDQFDGFFIEYDSQQAGDFQVLKQLHQQKIVLGLVTSKTPELESMKDLVARVNEARQFVPLEQICVSPQCGFASTEEGNHLTEEEQWAKVQLCTDLAKEISSF
ncbi:5-methyltetrahydropteroyltriglutamate--homocysteine S-methyltransferase [Vagococcus sp. BWB3-3]|uniref:5-methyltetrahydropteroyltriglutamate--homocysteine S-methyltransferase n=1 Tax=Vagococcus allomyrinae TaxID=2794353 RepID=A0A940SRQ7_9ENTE|nr:5-methyltetrahydropteroyltriglutamate--homocysteine S-methyltransferase [Vagococcus allomyrinae]MBP1041097.1 5-methyltetrahydropteroyltriglutamate--homocysteine S-methyltransferase [Vagococcus allomyrinae]